MKRLVRSEQNLMMPMGKRRNRSDFDEPELLEVFRFARSSETIGKTDVNSSINRQFQQQLTNEFPVVPQLVQTLDIDDQSTQFVPDNSYWSPTPPPLPKITGNNATKERWTAAFLTFIQQQPPPTTITTNDHLFEDGQVPEVVNYKHYQSLGIEPH